MSYTIKNILPIEIAFSKKAFYKLKKYIKKFPEKEWSGIIFYIRDHNPKVIIKDFYLLNEGTGTSTEFTFTKELFEYMEKNNLLGLSQGTLHSHNKMRAFFSFTDMKDIITQINARQEYLSIVINNNLEVVAKLAEHDQDRRTL